MSEVESGNIIEAINRAKVAPLFLKNGWMLYTPEADVKGVDFLIMQLQTEEIRKVQLKSRWTVHAGKYARKNIWMLFPDREKWYFCKHDEMVEIGLKAGLGLKSKAGEIDYSTKQMSAELAQLMSACLLPACLDRK